MPSIDQHVRRVEHQMSVVVPVSAVVLVALGYPHVRVSMVVCLASIAQLESVGDLAEAGEGTDHHRADVRYLGVAQVDAGEAPFRAVGDPWEACAGEDAQCGAAPENVRRDAVVVPGVVVAGKEGGRCDRHDHLAVAGRMAECAASAVS